MHINIEGVYVYIYMYIENISIHKKSQKYIYIEYTISICAFSCIHRVCMYKYIDTEYLDRLYIYIDK